MVKRHAGRELGAFPERPLQRRSVQARLRLALREDWDFGKGRIFGSMCTKPLESAVEASNMFITSNLGNPGLCPGTARLEEELIEMMLDIYHGPASGAGGHMVTGATEANITALWLARNLTGGNEVVLPESAHFSMFKALDLLGLRGRIIHVGEDGKVDVRAVKMAVSRRTAAIVGVAGTTELGAVDPIPELSEIALGKGVSLHVDAAFGGFVLPFLPHETSSRYPFDFALEGVSSICTDPHKMGLAPIPAGVLLVRRMDEMSAISVGSPYLSDPVATSLLGTRPSRSVAATYAAVATMGKAGYRKNVERVGGLTHELLKLGLALGLRPVIAPVMNIVVFRHENPMFVQDEMLLRGWDVSAVKSPSALRFVVMPHNTTASVRAMMQDLELVLGMAR